MSIYDGVVTLADDDIPVIVELNDGAIRLTASGTEIGHWPKGEAKIQHLADGSYAISAENEILSFVPSQPNLFAAAVNGSAHRGSESTVEIAPDERRRHETGERLGQDDIPEQTPDDVRMAPAPKPLTMGLFYALCAMTAVVAIWSIVNMLN